VFTITKPPIVAGDGLVHFATSRQIASEPSFNSSVMLIDDVKNTTELLRAVIDLPLGVNDKYFVRDRLWFKDSKGNEKSTNWSKPIIVTKNMDGFSINNTIIGTPKLSVDFNKDDAPLGGFEVTSDKYMLFKGIGEHKYTDWIIEDLLGNVVWSRKKDGYNLYSIKIPDCTLEQNKTYVLKCRYVSDTNMNSNYGKLTMCTNDYYMDNSCNKIDGNTVSQGDVLKMLVATTIYNII